LEPLFPSPLMFGFLCELSPERWLDSRMGF